MFYISLIAWGIIIGTFVIAFGGGGAAFYLGILTAIFGMPPKTAAATSLITAIPSIIVGTIGYWKANRINFRLGNQMLLAAVPSVIIGSIIAQFIPTDIYHWLIGVILMLLGLQILCQRSHSKHNSRQALLAVGYGILAGLMVGIAGLSGGGPILAGLLILGVDLFNAVATSSYVLIGMCSVGALIHISNGSVNWLAAIPLIIGSIIGALIAPRLVDWLDSKPQSKKILKPIMALFLFAMGIKTLL